MGRRCSLSLVNGDVERGVLRARGPAPGRRAGVTALATPRRQVCHGQDTVPPRSLQARAALP